MYRIADKYGASGVPTSKPLKKLDYGIECEKLADRIDLIKCP